MKYSHNLTGVARGLQIRISLSMEAAGYRQLRRLTLDCSTCTKATSSDMLSACTTGECFGGSAPVEALSMVTACCCVSGVESLQADC